MWASPPKELREEILPKWKNEKEQLKNLTRTRKR